MPIRELRGKKSSLDCSTNEWFFLGAWRLCTTRAFANASATPTVCGMGFTAKGAFALAALFHKSLCACVCAIFGRHYLCSCCWKLWFVSCQKLTRSRQREKWRIWDCIRAAERHQTASWCFTMNFHEFSAFACHCRSLCEANPLNLQKKTYFTLLLPKVMIKIRHWPLKNVRTEYESQVLAALPSMKVDAGSKLLR